MGEEGADCFHGHVVATLRCDDVALFEEVLGLLVLVFFEEALAEELVCARHGGIDFDSHGISVGCVFEAFSFAVCVA